MSDDKFSVNWTCCRNKYFCFTETSEWGPIPFKAGVYSFIVSAEDEYTGRTVLQI